MSGAGTATSVIASATESVAAPCPTGPAPVLPAGFTAATASAAIKKPGRPDMALLRCPAGATLAALYTTNQVCAAPVQLSRRRLRESRGHCAALLVNSGCANAATGDLGMAAEIQLTDALGRAGLRWVTWSALVSSPAENEAIFNAEVLVVDRVGRLSQLYRLGFLAVVGGGFGKGIHNTLEPAAHGLSVITGPRIARFREALALQEVGGLWVAQRPADLVSLVQQSFDDAEETVRRGDFARAWVQANTGAAHAIAAELARLAH